MPHLQSLRNSMNIFLVNLRNNLSIRPVLLIQVFAAIGPHAVAFLPPFVAWLLDKISEDEESGAMSPILMNSVILSVQKLMENFSGFLNPYFKKFVIATCR